MFVKSLLISVKSYPQKFWKKKLNNNHYTLIAYFVTEYLLSWFYYLVKSTFYVNVFVACIISNMRTKIRVDL